MKKYQVYFEKSNIPVATISFDPNAQRIEIYTLETETSHSLSVFESVIESIKLQSSVDLTMQKEAQKIVILSAPDFLWKAIKQQLISNMNAVLAVV